MAELFLVEIAGRKLWLPTSQVRTIIASGVASGPDAETVYLTPVPTAPPLVVGVTQIRGHIVPVVDIADPPRPMQPEDPLLVVEYGPARVALRVDKVLGEESPADGAERLDVGALFDRIRDAIADLGP